MAIKRCVCEHKYQDKKYGKGLRVHTEAQGGKSTKATCTVCASVK